MCSQRGTLHIACRELSYEPCRILVWWEFQVGKAKATNKLEYQLIASEPPPTSPRRKCPHTTTSTQCATCQGILGCLLGVDTALCQPLWFVGFFMMLFWFCCCLLFFYLLRLHLGSGCHLRRDLDPSLSACQQCQWPSFPCLT